MEIARHAKTSSKDPAGPLHQESCASSRRVAALFGI